MKFIIDRPIKGSYSEEVIEQQSHEFFYMEDKERAERNKLRWIELDDRVISGWIDEDGVAHRVIKETIEIIEVNTLEELYAITKSNEGKIVFGTNQWRENIDGWIEIYDDYRE
jgi:hypothetical protein